MPDFDENNSQNETGDQCFVVVISDADESFRYTNSDAPLEDSQGNAYEPVPLKIGELSADGAMGGGEVDVTLPRFTQVASRFLPEPRRTVYNVQIRRVLHQDGVITATRIAFTGVVKTGVGSGEEGELVVLKCSTQMYKLERNVLRRRYQHSCRPRCCRRRPPTHWLAPSRHAATSACQGRREERKAGERGPHAIWDR